MLSFQAEAVAIPIDFVLFAYIRSIQEIAHIELHARFGGQHFQLTAAARLINSGRQFRRPGPVLLSTKLWS